MPPTIPPGLCTVPWPPSTRSPGPVHPGSSALVTRVGARQAVPSQPLPRAVFRPESSCCLRCSLCVMDPGRALEQSGCTRGKRSSWPVSPAAPLAGGCGGRRGRESGSPVPSTSCHPRCLQTGTAGEPGTCHQEPRSAPGPRRTWQLRAARQNAFCPQKKTSKSRSFESFGTPSISVVALSRYLFITHLCISRLFP